MTVAFTQDEIIACTDWLRSQSMRDDLDMELREGLATAKDAMHAMVFDLSTVRKGLIDIRAFDQIKKTWIDELLGDRPDPAKAWTDALRDRSASS
jgi:hypothetical protein